MTIKECYKILQVKRDSDLESVKKAYRKRAFELHPDLHPNNESAGRDFQELNEAYVILAKFLEQSEYKAEQNIWQEAKNEAKQEAKQETKQENKQESWQYNNQEKQNQEKKKTADDLRKEKAAHNAYKKSKEEVIQDILNDPFAKRVFEDIYRESQVHKEEKKENEKVIEKPIFEEKAKPVSPTINLHVENEKKVDAKKGLVDNVKYWLKKQVDEEQKITMSASNLFPGARIRLQIRKGFSEETNTIELSLPADFIVGKPIRLKGLGKKIGQWQGDMYLTLLAK